MWCAHTHVIAYAPLLQVLWKSFSGAGMWRRRKLRLRTTRDCSPIPSLLHAVDTLTMSLSRRSVCGVSEYVRACVRPCTCVDVHADKSGKFADGEACMCFFERACECVTSRSIVVETCDAYLTIPSPVASKLYRLHARACARSSMPSYTKRYHAQMIV